MQESLQPDQAQAHAIDTPRILGELTSAEYDALRTEADQDRERREAMSDRLGSTALSVKPGVESVYVFEDDDEEKHYVVASGENKGDTIRPKNYAKYNLGNPSEELDKLAESKDMTAQEWGFFASMARMLQEERQNGTSPDVIDENAVDMRQRFIDSGHLPSAGPRAAFSPALEGAMLLMTLGAQRSPERAPTLLQEVEATGYLSSREAMELEAVVHELERIKSQSHEGYAPEVIDHGLLQSAAANIANWPKGERTSELSFLLDAYGLGVTLQEPADANGYLTHMQETITK